MSNIQFTSITTEDGQKFLTIFAEGRLLPPISDAHPNFQAVADICSDSIFDTDADIPSLLDLMDIPAAVAKQFNRLSDRVTAANGVLYLDGDEIANALTAQVLRFMEAGVEDWKPLLAFFEKVLANPNDHSREQLYSWLDKHEFTITPDGDIVGYKGVRKTADGAYESINRGPAIVDGVAVNGAVPNQPGSIVEISRGYVHHDPSVGCSTGLHVGTYEYASSFAQGALLEVHVNPRDVVSVPTDCDWQKVRCCRYTVVDVIEVKYSAPVLDIDSDDADDEFYLDDGDDW